MKYAIISDIHANRYALSKVLLDAAANGAGEIVCLGDIVGYGPEPKEALDEIRTRAALVVAGNHDDALSMRMNSDDFIGLAKDAILRHRELLSSQDVKYLHSLPYTLEIEGAAVSHGDFTDPPSFNYVETEDDARENFDATTHRLMFAGHTHEPGIFLVGASGTVYKTSPQDFTMEQGKRYIVNPGSVGYPRTKDGKCLSSYVLYDSRAQTVEFRFIPFAVSSVMQRGIGAKWKSRKYIILGGLLLLAMLAGALAWTFTPKEKTTIAQIPDGNDLLVKSKTLEVRPGQRFFNINLVLDKASKSAPVDLTVRFLDSQGKELNKNVKTIKAKATGLMEIPKIARDKCRCIEITLKKQKRTDRVTIRKFSPQILPAGKKR